MTDRIKRPEYLPIPNNRWGFKIANPEAEQDHYHDERYNEIPSSTGNDMSCTYKGCNKTVQTVCKGCVGYVCEEHLYRHPNCEEGR